MITECHGDGSVVKINLHVFHSTAELLKFLGTFSGHAVGLDRVPVRAPFADGGAPAPTSPSGGNPGNAPACARHHSSYCALTVASSRSALIGPSGLMFFCASIVRACAAYGVSIRTYAR